MPATLREGRARPLDGRLTPEALADLREFSVRMVERYFQALSKACRQVDPNHLNLGMRWAGVPPDWAVEGMKFFDVFSLNCYQEKLPAGTRGEDPRDAEDARDGRRVALRRARCRPARIRASAT